ncbi:PhzF family phenazine biosynthesis protein [Streptomyces sp. TS71-3]|uniref:PhzF family phenazine biosynthesis protein n=1 Tax=Streptomyces sp. TS71-3 TaxID=2733862 RepID=UPI001AFFD92F|nr:PhzF family phenazine biosynthesis isomerase [Streptomyces sp. TS71-3]GHJ36450.1 oxidoreductase [Streptomyces sp. TS71-3]
MTTTRTTATPAASAPEAGALPSDVLRYTAFSDDPAGGNPAGVVLDASGLDDAAMLAVAAEVGYSETAFLTAAPQEPGAAPAEGASQAEDGGGARAFTVRYFSPKAEVSFCGHATVASAVALAERIGPGEVLFRTQAGPVPVSVTAGSAGTAPFATLTSVEPHVTDAADDDVAEALAALDWRRDELDAALPPRIAYAGARHLVLAAASRARLADLAYGFDRLAALMHRLDLTTVQLVWRESETVFHVRDPFPVGGVVEDPATGAAAAAFGAYLRDLGLVGPDARLTLHQGHDLGRPSTLTVELRAGDPRVRVSGTAVAIG